MAEPRVAAAADVLFGAISSHRLIGLLSDADPSLDEDGGYEIALEVHARRLERGEQPLGRKIGFTNRTIWVEYGVFAPFWSYVYDSAVHRFDDSDARLAVGHLLQPRIEPEIILHFARTPPVTRDEAAILDCIDWIAQGFEIVQCPFANWKFTAADCIAAFGLHGGLVVGQPVAVDHIEDCVARMRTFTITLSGHGEPKASGGGANVLDSPLLAFAHLAEVLAAQSRFPPVHAGELVTTGTLTRPFPIAPGETWSTQIEGIDLPGLSIAFE